MRKRVYAVLLMFICLGFNALGQEQAVQEEKPKPSFGLSVQPGGMMIQSVNLGETYDLYDKSGVALIIENKDSSPHTYIVRAIKPSQAGSKTWLKGYWEIPDSSWFWLEKDEVTVPAQSMEAVKMFFKIPDEDKYYNQHWTVSLEVKGKTEPGRVLALAVYPRYQIETQSKLGLGERPYGLVGFEPCIVSFENAVLKTNEKKNAAIYNNDTITHTYKLSCAVIDVDSSREQISVSPGYEWIPNPKWIKLSKRNMKIMPGGKEELIVTVTIPKKGQYYQKKWESLVFVETKEGQTGFIRVQIQTQEK